MQSDFGICGTHLANGIFSDDTIQPKYRCADEFYQYRSDKAVQTRFHSDSLLHNTHKCGSQYMHVLTSRGLSKVVQFHISQ